MALFCISLGAYFQEKKKKKVFSALKINIRDNVFKTDSVMRN